MTHFTRSALAAAISLALLGCGDSTGPVRNVAELNGTWTRVPLTGEPAGSLMQWDLVTSDTVVTAHGNWSGEAGPAGELSGSGYFSHGVLHLDITLTTTVPQPSTQTRHQLFVGALASSQDLEGTLTYDGQEPAVAHMHKVAP